MGKKDKIEYKTDPKTGMAIIPKNLPKGFRTVKFRKVVEIAGLDIVKSETLSVPLEELRIVRKVEGSIPLEGLNILSKKSKKEKDAKAEGKLIR